VPVDRVVARQQLLERPEAAEERALEASWVMRGDPEGGVDSSRSALCEGDALVVRERRDEIGSGNEPDMSIDGVFGAREVVDERDERRADVGATRGENRVAFEDERREEAVAGGEALTDQCLGDGLGLVEVVDVLDDAEQISRIDTLGQRASGALAGKDRNRIDDGVAG
jgi:hypothetical protein